MSKEIKKLNTIDEWNEIKDKLNDKKEIILLKVSPSCSISTHAEEVVEEWFKNNSGINNLACYKINVINSRQLSAYLAEEYGIKHQSPQLIWLTSDYKVKWHASHFDIKKHNLDFNLKSD